MRAPIDWGAHGAIAWTLLLAGCYVFEPPSSSDAGEAAEEEGGAAPDGGKTAPTSGADYCALDGDETVPRLRPSLEPFTITTADHERSIAALQACGLGASLEGPDVFFDIKAEAGQRWHVMARAADPKSDVSLFVLRACDERACERGENVCPAGHSEHLNFVADKSGVYHLGIKTSVPSEVTLMALKPPCGDGTLQHGENCDDGNQKSGDGCDELCRAELQSGDVEVEPNNDLYEANVVRMKGDGTGKRSVRGSLTMACERDRFALLRVPEKGSVSATMLQATGEPCDSGKPGTQNVRLVLYDAAIGVERASVLGSAEGCPSLDGVEEARDLPAGEYHVVLEYLHPDDHDHVEEAPSPEDGGKSEHGDEGGHDATEGAHGASNDAAELSYELQIQVAAADG